MVSIDIKSICGEKARLSNLPEYEARAVELAGDGNDVTMIGEVPVWLYLRLVNALNGRCRSLRYESPMMLAPVMIFNHH